MPNEIAISNVQVPAHIAARRAAMAGQPSTLAASMVGGLTGSSGPRISIKGGRFRIVEDGDEVELPSLTLDAVIVGANPRMSKIFYMKAWEPGDSAAPDCFSDNAIAPDPSSPSPQSDLCATCPKNEWGSKITPQGKEIKACQDVKKIALVSADDMEGPVYSMSVTPGAFKNFTTFNSELRRCGASPEEVVISIGLDTSKGFPMLTFSLSRYMDDAEMAIADTLFDSAAVMEAIGNVDAPVVAAKIAAPVHTPPVKEVAKPVQEVVQEAAAPKRGFGAKAAAAEAPAAKGKGFAAGKAKPAEKVVEKVIEPEVVTTAEASDLDSAIDAMLAGLPSDGV